MLKNHLQIAFRAFRKSSVYGLLNVTGLALGIACAALIFMWVEDELTYDRQYAKHNELYSIRMNIDFSGKMESFTSVPEPMSNAIRETVPDIVNNSRVSFSRELFALNDKATYEYGLYVDTSFFSMLAFSFVSGNGADFKNPHTLVLSERMAQKFFGTANPVGKMLQVNNHQPFVVIGVVRNQPQNVTLQFDWLAPVSNFLEKNKWLGYWSTYGISTLVELKPGADINSINNQLTAILQSKDRQYAHANCQLWSMNDWHLRDKFTNGKQDGGQIKYVRLFTTIAWIILIIACINFMNLATARAGQRAREIGVRKSLGALRHSLISQFLLETLVMSFIAVLFAVLLVYISLPGFNMLVDKQLHFNPLTPAHSICLVLIGICCGLVAGSYPAFYLSSFNPVVVLKGLRIGVNGGAGFIRKGLVVTQFAISIMLIICTVIIYQQIHHIKKRDLGYNKQNLLYADLTGKMAEHFETIRTQLLQTGFVEDVALSNSPPLQMWSTTTSNRLTWKGSDPDNKAKIHWEEGTPQYISTMGLQLKEGRNFRAGTRSDSGYIIINESMATLMGKAGYVGSVVRFNDRYTYQVIGIVKDFLFNNMYGSVAPLMISCDPRNLDNFHVLNIRLKSGDDLSAMLTKVEAVIKANNPGYPFDYQFADEQFNRLFRMETRIGDLAGVFSLLAIFISCLGLFGLAAYTAERRRKEIGIRKVLGASSYGLATLLSKEFLQLVILSCVIAFPLAWRMMSIWLTDYAYRTAIHWWVFGMAGTAALLIALLTVSFQAVRGAISNPVKALRSE